MFRRIHEEARPPDPSVWRLPTAREARWRRWARRNRAAGHTLPLPKEEACWGSSGRSRKPARKPSWEAADDVVRLYVLRP